MIINEIYRDKISNKKLDKTIFTDENGNPIRIYYSLNSKHHREDSPAIIDYDENGDIEEEQYWEYGKEMDILKEIVIRGLRENL